MTWLGRLIRLIRRGPGTPTVKTVEKDGSFIEEAVSSYVAEHANNGSRLPLDGRYFVPPPSGVEKITNSDWTSMNVYEKARYDCENFALTLAHKVQREVGTNSVGIVIDWSGGHAYNIFVDSEQNVRLYEPQSGEFREPGSSENFAFENVKVII